MRFVLPTAALCLSLSLAPALAQTTTEAQPPHAVAEGGEAMRAPITSATLRQVQEALQRQGYAVGSPDGRWNEPTAQALREFQQAQGLEPSGELNSRTLGALGLSGG